MILVKNKEYSGRNGSFFSWIWGLLFH